jgi:hypothetical protein
MAGINPAMTEEVVILAAREMGGLVRVAEPAQHC